MPIVFRAEKGIPLTCNELDENFRQALARANHTGTQLASTISDFNSAVDQSAALSTIKQRLNSVEEFISSDSSFITEAELNSALATLESQIASQLSTLSTRVTALESWRVTISAAVTQLTNLVTGGLESIPRVEVRQQVGAETTVITQELTRLTFGSGIQLSSPAAGQVTVTSQPNLVIKKNTSTIKVSTTEMSFVGANVDVSSTGPTAVQVALDSIGIFQGVNEVVNHPRSISFSNQFSVTSGSDRNVSVAATGLAPINSPSFTGVPRVPNPSPSDSSTQIPTTAWVMGRLTSYAPLNSPAFTGAPTAPNPAVDENSTRVATTQWVNNQLLSVTGPDLSAYALLDSPTFIGTPRGPNPPNSENSTRLATTAWVRSAIALQIPDNAHLGGIPTATIPGYSSPANQIATIGSVRDYLDLSLCQCRISVSSSSSLSPSTELGTNEGTATLFVKPYFGNRVVLWNGTSWNVHQISLMTVDVSALSTNRVFDVFLRYNTITEQVEVGVIPWGAGSGNSWWRCTSTRTHDLEYFQGIPFINPAHAGISQYTARYIGTIRTDPEQTSGQTRVTFSLTDGGSGQSLGGLSGRAGIWNQYNRRQFTSQVFKKHENSPNPQYARVFTTLPSVPHNTGVFRATTSHVWANTGTTLLQYQRDAAFYIVNGQDQLESYQLEVFPHYMAENDFNNVSIQTAVLLNHRQASWLSGFDQAHWQNYAANGSLAYSQSMTINGLSMTEGSANFFLAPGSHSLILHAGYRNTSGVTRNASNYSLSAQFINFNARLTFSA